MTQKFQTGLYVLGPRKTLTVSEEAGTQKIITLCFVTVKNWKQQEALSWGMAE